MLFIGAAISGAVGLFGSIFGNIFGRKRQQEAIDAQQDYLEQQREFALEQYLYSLGILNYQASSQDYVSDELTQNKIKIVAAVVIMAMIGAAAYFILKSEKS